MSHSFDVYMEQFYIVSRVVECLSIQLQGKGVNQMGTVISFVNIVWPYVLVGLAMSNVIRWEVCIGLLLARIAAQGARD